MMNILVTGAKGFIGKNLIATLVNIKVGNDNSFGLDNDLTIYEYDVDTDIELLDMFCKNADFVFNFAGVNRPLDSKDFMKGNSDFLSQMLALLKKHNNTCPVMFASSIQAELDNPYGESKRSGENLLIQYGKETGAKTLIYRFLNVFGKWCRPNYNSVIATFCYNISRELPIQVNDPNVTISLVYIDDVIKEMIKALKGIPTIGLERYCVVPTSYTIKLGEIADMLYYFKNCRETKEIPDMTEDSFSKKLYATYLSYLPQNQFCYPLKSNIDERGSFTEIWRTLDRGQISVNISKPGVTKGEHWHHTKNEKFIVLSGKGLIQLRMVGDNEIVEYYVSGDKLEVIDIPVGYTHNIINIGDNDMITLMWCNECFDINKPDTFFLKVKGEK